MEIFSSLPQLPQAPSWMIYIAAALALASAVGLGAGVIWDRRQTRLENGSIRLQRMRENSDAGFRARSASIRAPHRFL